VFLAMTKKIYTRKGDLGKTFSGDNISVLKTAKIIEFYGAIDELNSFLGFAKVPLLGVKKYTEIAERILILQKSLFDLAPFLTAKNKQKTVLTYFENLISDLENDIDFYSVRLPNLQTFVIPGDSEISARFHLTRTICRRAEIATFKLLEGKKKYPNAKNVGKFLNRLSDWLFCVAVVLT
jgi:cob(I)alamin adenosyltransferase